MSLTVTNRNWFFRWAYLINFQSTRDEVGVTTLCSLFWRAALLTPLKIALFSLPVVVIGDTVNRRGWAPLLFAVGVVVVATGCAVGLGVLCEWSDRRHYRKQWEQRKPSFVREAIRGIKERYCPLVRVERVS